METEHEQPAPLPSLTTTNIPTPKYEDLMVSPPPAYCPPEGMAGPPFPFLRTASFPIQYGAYDAYTTHQTSPNSGEQLTPEAQALVDQYTAYFTELFTSWISYAVLFWNYGVPVVKWSSLFFIRGLGGWREYFLLSFWFLLWVAPGLYFGIVAKQVQDVKDGQQRFEGEHQPWERFVLSLAFWGAWSGMCVVKFGTLLYITGMSGWWMWGLWVCWAGLFGW